MWDNEGQEEPPVCEVGKETLCNPGQETWPRKTPEKEVENWLLSIVHERECEVHAMDRQAGGSDDVHTTGAGA